MNVKILIISLISVCGVITFLLSLISLKRRKTTGAIAFFGLMISITLYSWGYTFELNGTNLDAIMTTVRIQYLALSVLPAFWLILALQYTGFGKRLTPSVYMVIFIIPIITLVLINTNEYHHLFYTTIGIKQIGPFTLFTRTLGIGFWIQFAYLNLCTLVGNVFFFRMLLRAAPAYKKQAATMFAGSLFPWLINFLSHNTSLNPYEIDYNVYALAITSPFFAVAMFRSRMLDLAPVAHDRVFDSMTDSVFVVDDYGRIADINHAARMMKGISPAVIGSKLQDGLSHWPELVLIFERNEYGDHEVHTGPTGEEKWFMTNLSPFLDRNGQSIGQILIIRDISDKKYLEIKIFENEKRLKNDIMKVRNLQASILPDFSKIAGYDIGRIFIPVDELSGDFFDGFSIDNDIYQIILCDVIDHGITSAFIGMEIRSMFRAMSEPGIKPSELIARVNTKLVEDFSSLSLFATVAVCQIDLRSGQIIHSAGGHPPAFLYSAEERTINVMKKTGALIGLMPSKIYTDIVIDMRIHDILLLYTDGVYEAIIEETKDFYGTERMQSDLIANAGCSSTDILNSIIASVYSYTDYGKIMDDMTMVCIKKMQ